MSGNENGINSTRCSFCGRIADVKEWPINGRMETACATCASNLEALYEGRKGQSVAKKENGPGTDIDVPVKFGKIGIGAEVVSVPISIERDNISAAKVDKLFRNSRFNAVLAVDELSKNDLEGQKTLLDSEREIDVIVDVSGYRAGANNFAATLNFKKEEQLVHEIGQFANRNGTLVASRVGEAGEISEE